MNDMSDPSVQCWQHMQEHESTLEVPDTALNPELMDRRPCDSEQLSGNRRFRSVISAPKPDGHSAADAHAIIIRTQRNAAVKLDRLFSERTTHAAPVSFL